MEILTLGIKNKNKVRRFLSFIKDLEYVEVIKKESSASNKEKHSNDDFFALTGMWENRDIDADKLRAKAWPKTK